MKLFLSIGILLSGAVLFSGCGVSENQNFSDHENVGEYIDLEKIVKEEQEKSAYFTLEHAENNTVMLVLHNPKKDDIQSFIAKIYFPSHLVEVTNLTNISEETFGLRIKSDWGIDKEKGEIYLASTVSGSSEKLSERINIATFSFEKREENNTFLFDINENISKILLISKDNPRILNNILNKNYTKDLIIQ